MHILSRSFYSHDTVDVARSLLGKQLIRIINGKRLVSIIAETEAYRSDDPASHAFIGKTKRNSPLFGPVGHSYVYLSYGLHYCLNIVSHTLTIPAGGVLIRAIIPLAGKEEIEKRLGRNVDYIRGPGNVGKALGITFDDINIDVTQKDSSLIIAEGVTLPEECIEQTKRIGISKAVDRPWRFVIDRKKCPNLGTY